MNILYCFTRKLFCDGTHPSRLVYKEKGPEQQQPPQNENPDEPGLSFSERARRRARAKMKAAGEALDRGVKAAGEFGENVSASFGDTMDMYGDLAVKAGETVKGVAAETPDTLRWYKGMAVSGAETVGKKVKEGHQAAVEFGADVLTTADQFWSEKALAAWESVQPVAETLVGLGLMAKDKVTTLASGAATFTAEKFAQAVDWTKFAGRYVKDGVVDAGRVAKDLGKNALVFWGEVASDSYDHAVASGKLFVRRGKEIYDITTQKGRELARAASEKIKAGANEVLATVSPVFETVVGLGLLAKDKVVAYGTDLAEWGNQKFNAAVDYTKFAARYVRNGVVDGAKVAYEFGIEDPAKFWGELAADTQEAAIRQGQHFYRKGQEIYYVSLEKAQRVAREAKRVVIATGKEAYDIVRPGVETIAGLGLLAKDQLAKWGNDVGEWTVAQWNTVTEKTAFVARYVKNGVVDGAKVAYEFGIKDPAKFWGELAADTQEAAMRQGKQFYRKGKEIYYVSLEKAREVGREAKRVVIAAGREAAAGVETIAGLGLIAKDQLAKWGNDVSEWTVAQWNTVTEKATFVARYVKNGVVDSAKVAYEFGIKDPAKFWGELAADTKDAAIRQGKQFYRRGQEIVYLAQAEVGATLGKARARGQVALGTTPPEGEGRTAVAARRSPEGAGAVARPVAEPEALLPRVGLDGKVVEGAGTVARPTVAPESLEAFGDEKIYEVQGGDTMVAIARRFYGNQGRSDVKFALELQKYSLGQVALLKSGKESLIRPGEKIKLPKTFMGRQRKE